MCSETVPCRLLQKVLRGCCTLLPQGRSSAHPEVDMQHLGFSVDLLCARVKPHNNGIKNKLCLKQGAGAASWAPGRARGQEQAAAPGHGRNAALSSGFVPSDSPSRPVAWHSLGVCSPLLVTRLVMGQGEKCKGKLTLAGAPERLTPLQLPRLEHDH